jgi:hypothetical protein
MGTDFAKLFPSQNLREGRLTRAAEIQIRNAAIDVAKNNPPQKDYEAQVQAEWRRLSEKDRARLLDASPFIRASLVALQQNPAVKTERLAREFPSLAAELRATAKGK